MLKEICQHEQKYKTKDYFHKCSAPSYKDNYELKLQSYNHLPVWLHICCRGRELTSGFQHHGQMPAELSSSGREELQNLGQRLPQLHWASSHNITLHLFTAGFSNLGYLRLFFQLTGHGQLILRCRKTLHQSITLLPPICRQTVIWNITFHFIDKGTETSKWKNTWSALNSTVQKFYTTVLNQEQTCRRWREYKSHISLGLQSCMHKNKRPPNFVCLTVKRSLASCKPFQNTTSSCQNSLGANLHKDSGWLSAARTNFLFWGCSAAQHKQTTVKLYKTEKVLSFIS